MRARLLRRRISYASEPGSRVPGYLLVPKRVIEKPDTKATAILCLHPTNNKDGVKTVVGLGSTENRQYAKELAERGFVTLAPACILCSPTINRIGRRWGM